MLCHQVFEGHLNSLGHFKFGPSNALLARVCWEKGREWSCRLFCLFCALGLQLEVEIEAPEKGTQVRCKRSDFRRAGGLQPAT